MIYVDARGRIGNQMFQYAIARNLQLKNGQKMVISSYNLKKYHKDWPYLLNEYVLNDNVIHTDKKLPWYANVDGIIMKSMRHFFPEMVFKIGRKLGIYMLMDSKYREFQIEDHKNHYFIGTWQCEKYFEENADTIKKELSSKYVNYEKNHELYDLIKNTESVCISIRRGDYVDDPNTRKKFYVCDEKYFQDAIQMIKKDIPNAVVFLFSNDVEWAKSTLSYDGLIYSEAGDDTPEEKLNLMSACKHFVLSNSTFSWWAQYMSTNDNKKVYAPSKWMVDHKDKSECALYSNSWTIIEV